MGNKKKIKQVRPKIREMLGTYKPSKIKGRAVKISPAEVETILLKYKDGYSLKESAELLGGLADMTARRLLDSGMSVICEFLINGTPFEIADSPEIEYREG
jgi:predicted DNA-binding protein (UPF0251 family)